jgi:hypothetical protein
VRTRYASRRRSACVKTHAGRFDSDKKEQDETTRQFPAQGVRDTPYEPSSPKVKPGDVYGRPGEGKALDSDVERRQWNPSVQAKQWWWTLPKAQRNRIMSCSKFSEKLTRFMKLNEHIRSA